jgi:hypothetical protein
MVQVYNLMVYKCFMCSLYNIASSGGSTFSVKILDMAVPRCKCTLQGYDLFHCHNIKLFDKGCSHDSMQSAL